METSPLICFVNQWIDFYMIGTSIMKELKLEIICHLNLLLYIFGASTNSVYFASSQ